MAPEPAWFSRVRARTSRLGGETGGFAGKSTPAAARPPELGIDMAGLDRYYYLISKGDSQRSVQDTQISSRVPNLLDLLGTTYSSAESDLGPSTGDDITQAIGPSVGDDLNKLLGTSVGDDFSQVLGASVGDDIMPSFGPSAHAASLGPSVGDDILQALGTSVGDDIMPPFDPSVHAASLGPSVGDDAVPPINKKA